MISQTQGESSIVCTHRTVRFYDQMGREEMVLVAIGRIGHVYGGDLCTQQRFQRSVKKSVKERARQMQEATEHKLQKLVNEYITQWRERNASN